MTRYALYYTPPPGGALERLGRAWFADPGAAALTAQARVYGFHATLKAPFRLAEGCEESALAAAVTGFAAERLPVEVGPLRVADLHGFLALVPQRQRETLSRFAADCVVAFDHFRAPPTAEELARRRSSGLGPRQEEYLARWGYPYVLDEFRFHMTLTRRLSAKERAAALPRLQALAAPALAEPLTIDAVSLCVQPAAGADFRVRERLPLSGRGEQGPRDPA